MEILAAEEELRAGVENDDRLYDLVLSVTGSAERASAALSQRIMARMKRGDTSNVGGG